MRTHLKWCCTRSNGSWILLGVSVCYVDLLKKKNKLGKVKAKFKLKKYPDAAKLVEKYGQVRGRHS